MISKKSPAQAPRPNEEETKPPTIKKTYTVSFYHDWCKECGLCIAFCQKQIIQAAQNGKPQIKDAERCIGCRFCEMHCPDFAITVERKTPQRRKTDE